MEPPANASRSYYLEERREAILLALQRHSMVRVTDLSRDLGVSTATIRKDISALERLGKLRRTHGGAIPARVDNVEERFDVARTIMRAEKVRIGRAAAKLVQDGDILFVQSGSTCLEFVRALKGKTDLTVITSDLLIGMTSEEVLQDSTVIMLGGTLRFGYHYTQGLNALRQLENYYVPTAFLCANALSFERGVTAHRREQAEWVGALVENSERPVMLLDSSKIGENALVRAVGLEDIDALITDTGVDDETRRRFEREAPKLEVTYA